ncbi:MAG TPA: prenyltransferase/squalene oxidase repeat-containing protein [Pirellulales bacterium]
MSRRPSSPDHDPIHAEPLLWQRSVWRMLPCWLVSALIHMVAILVLGVWMLKVDERPGPLALSAIVSEIRAEDEIDHLGATLDLEDIQPAEMPIDTEPAPADTALSNEIAAVESPQADLLAGPELSSLPSGKLEPGQVLAGRDPRLRGQLALREGGTSETEAAVNRALVWLARHQSPEGSWSLNHFNQAGDCAGRCGDPGVESDTSGTALGLLPFLGAGQTHLRGEYTMVVARGLRWLIDHQGKDGDLRGRGRGNMYAHGQAAIALCEAYALTQADNLRQPAQKSIDFIVAAQHDEGGWRYQPKEPGDLSVVGWQLMALRSAQMAYLKIPAETLTRTNRFLNSVQTSPSSGQYCYMPGGHPSETMTAEGLLCRQYSGWRHNHPALNKGVQGLLINHLPKSGRVNMYYWYYGTQVMHHMGGDAWQKWNGALRDMLVAMQERTGHQDGSWTPQSAHDPQGGRLYMTSLATLTLEVYYRHLPLYRGVAADHEPAAKSRKRKP